jgi:hypothetical protein
MELSEMQRLYYAHWLPTTATDRLVDVLDTQPAAT